MKYKVYYGGDRCMVYNGGYRQILNTPPYKGTEEDDAYANDYIHMLDSMDIGLEGDDLLVSFTMCDDEELLKRVDAGSTRVRIQLLVHKTSACARTKRPNTTWHCLKINPGFYWNNRGVGMGQKSTWARTHGRDDGYSAEEAPCYIDLTREELERGWCTIPNAVVHAHGNNNCNGPGWLGDALSVEMFCPALYRHNKDIYYYERVNKIYAISDSYVSI